MLGYFIDQKADPCGMQRTSAVLLVSLWKQHPLLLATWAPSMWFYWTRLIRERWPQRTVRRQTPRCLVTIILREPVRKLRPSEVIKVSEHQTVFYSICKKPIQTLLLPAMKGYSSLSLCVQPERQKNKKAYFLKLLYYSPRAAMIGSHTTIGVS